MVQRDSFSGVAKDFGALYLIPIYLWLQASHAISDILVNITFLTLGLYSWEIISTLEFEWSLITRKRKFSWPLVSRPTSVIFLFTTNGVMCLRIQSTLCTLLPEVLQLMNFQPSSFCADIASYLQSSHSGCITGF